MFVVQGSEPEKAPNVRHELNGPDVNEPHHVAESTIMIPVPRLRLRNGWAFLSSGFRPFFLLGSIYAGLAMLIWLPVFTGELDLTTIFAPGLPDA